MSSNAEAYDYLAESILAWPDQKELAALMQQAGWRGVGYKNLSGGIVAVHRATRPADSAERETRSARPDGGARGRAGERRDRSYSASKSVRFQLEIGHNPVRGAMSRGWGTDKSSRTAVSRLY